jgi:glycosyltransferase involved in cell wall biosynthesis
VSESSPRATIVIPAHNEGDHIVPGLKRIIAAVETPAVIVVVVDTEDDTTIPSVQSFAKTFPTVRVSVNDYGRGPANAIRYGIDHATTRTVVVTMADGCDDPRQIDDLVLLVERGVVVAAASRYMAGGQQVGAASLKSFLSRTAGRSLHALASAGTRDATNSFKAYDAEFVRSVGIDSRDGFEIGLELTAKARRLRLPVAEIPTIWLDRTAGESSFRLAEWIPKYLRWYRFAFGPRLTLLQLNTKMKRETA